MPDLKRFCIATAAAALLAALAGGQQTSPFRQPPIMPPEITPGNGAPPLLGPLSVVLDLDNAQMRVVRYRLEPRQILELPGGSPGSLLVALSALQLRAGTTQESLRSGQTRWISPGAWVVGPDGRRGEFLLVQPKRN
jgi:hypothetical protein